MDENTLYYFFSSIAQVLAATTSLIVIILQYLLDGLKRYLIGDGQATYYRENEQEGGDRLDKKYLDRLRDSIEREDLNGIDAVLKQLNDKEELEDHTLASRQRGMQYHY